METLFKKPLVATLAALLCCGLWGSAFPCIKLGYEWLTITDTGSQLLFAGYRFFLAGIVTLLFSCILEHHFPRLPKNVIPAVLGQGLLQTTAQYVFFYIGLAHTTGSKSSILDATSTFFAILLAHFLLKNEPLTPRKLLGCLVGFGGVILVNLQGGLGTSSSFSLQGEGMVLLSAALYGLSSVTLKWITPKASPTAITAYQLLFGSAVLLLIGFLLGGSVTGFTLKSILLLLYMAFLSAVAFSLWTTLLKYHPVGTISVYSFSIPVFGSLLSGLLLHEDIFSWMNLVALLLVSLGIILVNRVPKSDKRKCE